MSIVKTKRLGNNVIPTDSKSNPLGPSSIGNIARYLLNANK